MRKLLILLAMVLCMAIPVAAQDYTAPEVPDSAQDLMPVHKETFWEGVLEIFGNAVSDLQPKFISACGVCVSLIAVVMLVSITEGVVKSGQQVFAFVSAIAVSMLLIGNTKSMITLAGNTVKELSEYGKLLLPVMTAVLASQGGPVTSAALYAGTAAFDAVLGRLIAALLIPVVFLFLTIAVVYAATGEEMLKRLRDFTKSFCSWALKIILYIFTGYVTVTGVVSGATDAAALKATKLTISGMIPVVGGILSEASEAVLVGAGVMKNAAGIYGLLALIALWIAPFLQIAVQYLLLKATAAICEVFGAKRITDLIGAFSASMGLLLAMTGSVCFMLLISTVCFMRGFG